jgi:hypothetical protein
LTVIGGFHCREGRRRVCRTASPRSGSAATRGPCSASLPLVVQRDSGRPMATSPLGELHARSAAMDRESRVLGSHAGATTPVRTRLDRQMEYVAASDHGHAPVPWSAQPVPQCRLRPDAGSCMDASGTPCACALHWYVAAAQSTKAEFPPSAAGSGGTNGTPVSGANRRQRAA